MERTSKINEIREVDTRMAGFDKIKFLLSKMPSTQCGTDDVMGRGVVKNKGPRFLSMQNDHRYDWQVSH